MKKLLLPVVLIAIVALGCSDDDGPKTDKDGLIEDKTNTYKTIVLYKTCQTSDGGAVAKLGGIRYCVTDEMYDLPVHAPNTCSIVTIIDVDGVARTGYWGNKYEEGICKRKP